MIWTARPELDELTRLDSLTGLPNRAYFHELVAELLVAGDREKAIDSYRDALAFETTNAAALGPGRESPDPLASSGRTLLWRVARPRAVFLIVVALPRHPSLPSTTHARVHAFESPQSASIESMPASSTDVHHSIAVTSALSGPGCPAARPSAS